jgi:hypothetical protein
MKERPILLKRDVVRAILAGTLTEVRRPLRVGYHPAVADWVLDSEHRATARAHSETVARQYVTTFPNGRALCPFGVPGDRLWVRETWAKGGAFYIYAADTPCSEPPSHNTDEWNAPAQDRWRPSVHMPRRACRLMLEVQAVRLERLRDDSIAPRSSRAFEWEWVAAVCKMHVKPEEALGRPQGSALEMHQ